MREQLIIKVLGKYWKYTTYHAIDDDAMPISLLFGCDEIFNITRNKVVKSRESLNDLPDYVKMMLWLGEELPEFQYDTHHQFRYQLTEYRLTEYKRTLNET